MVAKSERRPVCVFVFAVAAILIAGDGVQAECYPALQALPAQTISAFTANPAQLLLQYPDGGGPMISRIRDLAASDPATLQLILGLTTNANSDQLSAIGAGLGQAALVCIRTDQAYSTEIQQAVAAANNNAVTLAFAAVLGDRPIGAVGGGGGDGGGGGGPTDPFSGPGTFFTGGTFPSSGTKNSPTTFSILTGISNGGSFNLDPPPPTTSVSPSK
jgi:hypothetical protein